MKKFLSLVSFFSICLGPISLSAKRHPADHYLHRKISKNNFRYMSFLTALELMGSRKMKTIVETGTSRSGDMNYAGDGGSTIIFSEWAKDYKAEFYSVDLCEEYLINAEDAVRKQIGNHLQDIHFVCSDSVSFLRDFGKKIDFLYLDSYDFDVNNPLPSQYHHLFEIEAAYPYLTEDSIVMIDDCGLPHGGKGKLAIEFLLERGWQIIVDLYQVVLIYSK